MIYKYLCVKLSFCLLGPFPSVPSLYKIHFIQQAKVVELGTSIFEKNTANTLAESRTPTSLVLTCWQI